VCGRLTSSAAGSRRSGPPFVGRAITRHRTGGALPFAVFEGWAPQTSRATVPRPSMPSVLLPMLLRAGTAANAAGQGSPALAADANSGSGQFPAETSAGLVDRLQPFRSFARLARLAKFTTSVRQGAPPSLTAFAQFRHLAMSIANVQPQRAGWRTLSSHALHFFGRTQAFRGQACPERSRRECPRPKNLRGSYRRPANDQRPKTAFTSLRSTPPSTLPAPA